MDSGMKQRVVPEGAKAHPKTRSKQLGHILRELSLGHHLGTELTEQNMSTKQIVAENIRTTEGLFAIFVIILCVGLSAFLLSAQERQWLQRYREDIVIQTTPYAESLRVQVEKSVSAAYAVASIVGVNSAMANSTMQV
jgi:hypothetical protein